MPEYRMGQAAQLLGISADTLRRWADGGRIATHRTSGGHRVLEGADLARLSVELSESTEHEYAPLGSARNRLTGIVTRVMKDEIVAKVEMQTGPFRMVSLMTREAADELHLEPGVMVVAVVKSTNVVVEVEE
jgi:molybdopterin-binding protein